MIFKNRYIIIFIIVLASAIILSSCQPATGQGLNIGNGIVIPNDGVYVLAYHGEFGKLGSRALPISLGPGIQDATMNDDQAVLSFVNVSDSNYTILFNSITFEKASSGNRIVISKSDLNSNDFTYIDNLEIRIKRPGEEEELVAIYKTGDLHNWQDLQAMRNNLAEDYIVKKNIILSDYTFEPVGTVEKPFTGSLLGENGGKRITGVQTEGVGNYQGLFGVVEVPFFSDTDEYVVKDLILENFNISGNAYVGLVAGWIKVGRVINVRAIRGTVNVEGSVEENQNNYGFGGGLVGKLGVFDIVDELDDVNVPGLPELPSFNILTAFISNSSAEVPVTGSDSNSNAIGGLVGYTGKNAAVSSSYATGNVKSNGSYIGGLIGYSESLDSVNNYSTGNVNGFDAVGGVIGKSATIRNLYATGDVIGRDYVGGLVGEGIKNDFLLSGRESKIVGYAFGNVYGRNFVGGLVGHSVTDVIGYATGNVNASETFAGGLVGGSTTNNTFKIIGYSIGKVNATRYAGGIYGATRNEHGVVNNEVNPSIIGYSRSIVQRSSGTFTEFGTIAGSSAVDTDSTYHSIARNESKLLSDDGTDFEGTGANGTDVKISKAEGNNYEAVFSNLTFGYQDRMWLKINDFVWPAIYINNRYIFLQPVN